MFLVFKIGVKNKSINKKTNKLIVHIAEIHSIQMRFNDCDSVSENSLDYLLLLLNQT